MNSVTLITEVIAGRKTMDATTDLQQQNKLQNLAITIVQTMSGDRREPFGFRELHDSIYCNQTFHAGRFNAYKDAEAAFKFEFWLFHIMNVLTLGFAQKMGKIYKPRRATSEELEKALEDFRPDIVLPLEVLDFGLYEITDTVDTLHETGGLNISGEGLGKVYLPQSTLWKTE